MDLIEKTKNAKRHPWELSRSHSIMKLLPSHGSYVYADIGAGDRFFTSQLPSITDGSVYAIDNQYGRDRSKEDGIICLHDHSLLEDGSVDCLIMMDVLEHVENENAFLRGLLEKLKPGGRIVLTVPAMQFLFSSHDVFLKHFRRYSRKQLIDVLRSNNILVEQCHYFYSSLFFIRCITSVLEKLGSKKKENVGIGMWSHDENSYMTRFFLAMLNIDFYINKTLNKISIHFPGLSLVATCRKKS